MFFFQWSISILDSDLSSPILKQSKTTSIKFWVALITSTFSSSLTNKLCIHAPRLSAKWQR